MRWKDSAGPFVVDDEERFGIRKRRIGDDPNDACFVCNEGIFVEWDGYSWVQAPLKHGMDFIHFECLEWMEVSFH